MNHATQISNQITNLADKKKIRLLITNRCLRINDQSFFNLIHIFL